MVTEVKKMKPADSAGEDQTLLNNDYDDADNDAAENNSGDCGGDNTTENADGNDNHVTGDDENNTEVEPPKKKAKKDPKPSNTVAKKKAKKGRPTHHMHREFDQKFISKPPPPPPPPVDNPYYQQFVRDYWKNLHSSRVKEIMEGEREECAMEGTPTYEAIASVGAMGMFPPMPPMKGLMQSNVGVKSMALDSNFPFAIETMPPTNPTKVVLNSNITRSKFEYPRNNTRHKTYFFCSPNDSHHLSDLMCYFRSRIVELFLANEKDVSASFKTKSGKSKKNLKDIVALNQVGIRCVYCAKYPIKDRSHRSESFLRSVSSIHALMENMQLHCEACPAVPAKVLKEFRGLNSNRPNLESPKNYVETWCRKVGLVDVEKVHDEKGQCTIWGVRLRDDHQLVHRGASTSYIKTLFVPPEKMKLQREKKWMKKW